MRALRRTLMTPRAYGDLPGRIPNTRPRTSSARPRHGHARRIVQRLASLKIAFIKRSALTAHPYRAANLERLLGVRGHPGQSGGVPVAKPRDQFGNDKCGAHVHLGVGISWSGQRERDFAYMFRLNGQLVQPSLLIEGLEPDPVLLIDGLFLERL